MISSFKLIVEISLISVLAYSCLGQSGGMIALTNIETNEKTDTSVLLSKKDLKSIYGFAKNLSYSKGSIIKSRDGDFEYRRSFTYKVELEVNSLYLQDYIGEIKKIITEDTYNKSLLLENLDFLENLVHQYDIGKKFVDIGGFQLILSLTKYDDDDVSKAAFMILSAAMQGNEEVQLYATKTDLLKFIINTLSLHFPNRTSSALITVSTFIRNCPDALAGFIKEKGLQTLSNLLTNSYTVQRVQMRIIDLLRDLTAEFFGENLDTVSSVLLKVKKNFTYDLESYSICDKIVELFLTAYEYKTHEKIIAAMNTMFDVCEIKFRERNLVKEIETLLKLYDPFKTSNLWYEPLIDSELRFYIFEDLKELRMKLKSHFAHLKNEVRSVKSEL